MGYMVSRDDGWRMPEWLWERIEPLLPAPPFHPLGCHRSRVPNRDAMDAGSVGAEDGDAVERVERDRGVLVVFGASAFSGVGAGRGVRSDLAAGIVGLRRGGGDRLVVACR